MSDPSLSPADEALLRSLREAVARAPTRPQEIEVGIALSIVLGRLRPAVSCGGCSTPLEFEGIPARTNVGLGTAFRLIGEPSGLA
ncbi:MAG TPA: hypothetical protein VLX64_01865 [Thermoplasmata archaeon]|nr:hypothetical protein [Thermoplasmata archaeon]